jgi:hypothetical protein
VHAVDDAAQGLVLGDLVAIVEEVETRANSSTAPTAVCASRFPWRSSPNSSSGFVLMRRQQPAWILRLVMGQVTRQLFRTPVLPVIGALIGLAFPNSADARVFLNHQRVTVTLVGGISAEPCADPHGCARGIVELRWGSFHALHHVRCLRPRALHVVAAKRHQATVFACRRLYRWLLP